RSSARRYKERLCRPLPALNGAGAAIRQKSKSRALMCATSGRNGSASQARRQITVIKMQCTVFFISSGWKTWVRARHQRLLQLPSHEQIRFHFLVLRQNFAIALFQVANVGQQKRVLHFE